MPQLLNNPIEAIERKAVESLMATLVAQFNAIGTEVWRIQDLPKTMSNDQVAQFQERYRMLSRIFDEVLLYGRSVERLSASKIAGKAEFLSAWKELKGMMAVDPSHIDDSLEELRRGGGKSLGEFADELSRDLKQ